MKNDISESIETAAPTNNEEEEEDIIPVELVDEVDRFKDEFGEDEAVTIRFRILYEPGPMESQRAVPVEIDCDYEQEGQVIVRIKTKIKHPPPPRGNRPAITGISKKRRKGSDGSATVKDSKFGWSKQQHDQARKAKAKPKPTTKELIKELGKCNRKLKNKRRHVDRCEEEIQELKKENKVMTRAQRSQQKEMDKLNNKHSALKQKLDKKEDYIVEQNRNHWQKIKDNRLFFCQQHE